MGERAQKVVVRHGRVERYSSQWGGQSCAEVLLDGPSGLQEDLNESRHDADWMDADFAEGGFLVDFDDRRMLLFSWDADLVKGLIEELRAAWPDWSIAVVNEGVPDFQRYVEQRAI